MRKFQEDQRGTKLSDFAKKQGRWKAQFWSRQTERRLADQKECPEHLESNMALSRLGSSKSNFPHETAPPFAWGDWISRLENTGLVHGGLNSPHPGSFCGGEWTGRGDLQGKQRPSANLSNNFARDLDEDTKGVFIQTWKAQVILIQLIYDPKFSSQAECWAKINKKKFNSNRCKVRHF